MPDDKDIPFTCISSGSQDRFGRCPIIDRPKTERDAFASRWSSSSVFQSFDLQGAFEKQLERAAKAVDPQAMCASEERGCI